MAKRARGSSTRPGQRPPLQRSSTTRPATSSSTAAATPATGSTPSPGPAAAATSRPATLTAEEEARAAELEAQILAEERAAEDAVKGRRDRQRRGATPAEPAVRGTIAVRAAAEYDYVARDLRRVTIIGGGLTALLLGLWVVVQITGSTL